MSRPLLGDGRQHGMTLVELVITIVVLGIASAALFSAMAAIICCTRPSMFSSGAVA